MKKFIIAFFLFSICLLLELKGESADFKSEVKRYADFVRSEMPNYLKSRPKTEDSHLVSTKNRITEFSILAKKIDENESVKQIKVASLQKSNIFNDAMRAPNLSATIPAALEYFLGPNSIVNPANGELLFSEEALSFPKRQGIGISFKRTYSSLYHYDGPMGFGWEHQYNSRIVLDSDKIDESKTITLWLNAQKIVFKKCGNVWKTLDTYKLQLKIDNEYVDIYNRNWDRVRFEKSSKNRLYRLHSISGRFGDYKVNFVKMKYAPQKGSDVLSEVSDHYGNVLKLSYNDSGRIESVSDGRRLLRFTYQDNKLISSTIESVLLSFDKKAESLTSHYGYKTNDGIIVLNSKKNFFEKLPMLLEYDKNGRVLSVSYGGNNDRKWTISYQKDGVECIQPFPSPKVKYLYNAKAAGGFLPNKIVVGTNNGTTTLLYDDAFNVIREVSSIGTITTYKYQNSPNNQNLCGLCIEEMIQPSQRTKNSFDAKIIRTAYLNDSVLPISIKTIQLKDCTETIFKEETFSYDKNGLLKNHNNGGIEYKYFYNKFGNMAVSIDANNSSSIYYYADNYIQKEKFIHEDGTINGNGLLLRKIDDADTELVNKVLQEIGQNMRLDPKILPSVNLETKYTYNHAGMPHFIKNEDVVSLNLYNSLGLIVAKYNSDNGVRVYSLGKNLKPLRIFSEAAQKSAYTSGIMTDLPFIDISGLFYFSEYEYDNLGGCISETKTNESFLGKKMIFYYNRYPDGRLKSITTPLGVVRNDEYDENGLLISHYLVNANDKFIIDSDFKYYPNGVVKSYKDRLGNYWENSIDGFGENIETRTPDGHIISREFDVLGNLINEKTLSGNRIIKNVHFEYTEFGSLKKKTELHVQAERSEEIVTEENYYDGAGNKIKYRTARNGSIVNNIFDGLNRNIISISPNGDLHYSVFDGLHKIIDAKYANINDKTLNFLQKYEYFNFLGQNVSSLLVGKDGKVVIEQSVLRKYAANGMLLEETFPQQLRKLFQYDTVGNIIKTTTIPFDRKYGETNIEIDFSFNAAKQLVRKLIKNRALALKEAFSTPRPELISAKQETIYEYDNLGRLFKEIHPDGIILTKSYNNHSLPKEFRWSHLSDKRKLLRQIFLSYTKMGQVSELSTPNGTPIRKMTYDDYGNCNFSAEFSGTNNIKVYRQYSSFGHIISENVEINGKRLPGFKIYNDFYNGLVETKWEFLETEISSLNWNVEKITFDTENRPCKMYIDSSEFINWKYANGNIYDRELIWEGVHTIYEYSPLNQTTAIGLYSSYGNNILQNRYNYNDAGLPFFSSYKIDSIGKPSEFVSYTEFDNFGRMSAQNSEYCIPNIEDIHTRFEKIFYSGESRLGYSTVRRAYDSLNNNWLTYTGILSKNYNPIDFINKKARMVSPSEIISGTPTSLQMMDLASNRDVSIIEFHEDDNTITKNKKYDRLGNLVEYEGRFYNGDMFYDVRWTLTYDILGRLEKMNAIINDDKNNSFQKGKELAELNFFYDSYNRRIFKQVIDKTRENPLRKELFTVYKNNLQALVLEESKDSKLYLREQYLWGNGQRELLSAILATDNNTNSERYYFYQDRSLNIAATLRRVAGELKVIDIANYIGFGENSTIAKIKSVKSSLTDNPINPERVLNLYLDDIGVAKWHNYNKNETDFFEIDLTETCVIESIKLWARSFPKDFAVYVLDDTWSARQLLDGIKSNDFRLKNKFVPSKFLQKENGYNEIYLYGKRGQKIIIVWDGKDFSKDIELSQIEIRGAPKAKFPIAFAGQILDIETGLYYQINRYRPQDSDKFISPDSIGFLGGDNLYAYANANPLQWHDPDGNIPVPLITGFIGGVIGGGLYAVNCWWNEKDFEWGEFGISVGAGFVAGLVGGGASSSFASMGINATANAIITGTVAGFSGGMTEGMGNAILKGESIENSLIAGLKSGAWSAATGAVGGSVLSLSYTGVSFGGTLISGTVAGGFMAGGQAAVGTFSQTGDWEESLNAGFHGAMKGAVAGAIFSGIAWAGGRATEIIVPLKDYPKGLPDPRSKGLLIKTKPNRGDYGGVLTKEGYARHHVKPLSLGGRDSRSNMALIPVEVHRAPHPGPYINSKPIGTLFY